MVLRGEAEARSEKDNDVKLNVRASKGNLTVQGKHVEQDKACVCHLNYIILTSK